MISHMQLSAELETMVTRICWNITDKGKYYLRLDGEGCTGWNTWMVLESSAKCNLFEYVMYHTLRKLH